MATQRACVYTHTLTEPVVGVCKNRQEDGVYTDAYTFCLQCLLLDLSIELQAEMSVLQVNFESVHLFIMQQEYSDAA